MKSNLTQTTSGRYFEGADRLVQAIISNDRIILKCGLSGLSCYQYYQLFGCSYKLKNNYLRREYMTKGEKSFGVPDNSDEEPTILHLFAIYGLASAYAKALGTICDKSGYDPAEIKKTRPSVDAVRPSLASCLARLNRFIETSPACYIASHDDRTKKTAEVIGLVVDLLEVANGPPLPVRKKIPFLHGDIASNYVAISHKRGRT